MNKIIILTCFVACFAGLVCAAETNFVELTDANQAILGLELSKSVKGIQEAFGNGFAFSTVTEASKFLRQCHHAKDSMNSVQSDGEFEGLAGQIKSLLAEPKMVEACKLQPNELNKFSVLETYVEPKECEYMTKKTLRTLMALESEINSSESLRIVLGHLLHSATSGLGKALLNGASQDVEILFGEQLPKRGMFDFEYRFKSGCSLSLLNPICKLVRRSSNDDIQAIGADVADFVQVLATKDQATIGDYETKSGVQVGQLKELCKPIKKLTGVVGQIDAFKAANYVSEAEVSSKLAEDKSLDLYYNIDKLCDVVSV